MWIFTDSAEIPKESDKANIGTVIQYKNVSNELKNYPEIQCIGYVVGMAQKILLARKTNNKKQGKALAVRWRKRWEDGDCWRLEIRKELQRWSRWSHPNFHINKENSMLFLLNFFCVRVRKNRPKSPNLNLDDLLDLK